MNTITRKYKINIMHSLPGLHNHNFRSSLYYKRFGNYCTMDGHYENFLTIDFYFFLALVTPGQLHFFCWPGFFERLGNNWWQVIICNNGFDSVYTVNIFLFNRKVIYLDYFLIKFSYMLCNEYFRLIYNKQPQN